MAYGVAALPNNANEAQRTALNALKKKDYNAMFFIHQCVDLINFPKV
jgi:HEPN domain-containing protein